MKRVIVTGAAGFAGSILTERLISIGVEVYAVVRPESPHNIRLLQNCPRPKIIELDMESFSSIAKLIPNTCDVCFHLAWRGARDDFESQKYNVLQTLDVVNAVKKLGCKRIVITGSQAEYGIVPIDEKQFEDRPVSPYTAYGSAKVAACYLSRQLANDSELDWVWGRVFSLIGKNEPGGRMLPDLYRTLMRGEDFYLSSARQNWDYLDVYDAADALIALARFGKNGEIYNIASGDYHPLNYYTEMLRNNIDAEGRIYYGDDPVPFVSLQPSVEKIYRDTGWTPKKDFFQSINFYSKY